MIIIKYKYFNLDLDLDLDDFGQPRPRPRPRQNTDLGRSIIVPDLDISVLYTQFMILVDLNLGIINRSVAPATALPSPGCRIPSTIAMNVGVQ